MLGAVGGAVQREQAAPFQDAIDDREREILVMEHLAPPRDGFVGGEDHGALPPVPIVDDVKEHVRRIRAIGKIADFVDDEHRGLRIRRERVAEVARPKTRREVIDQFGRGDEAGIEAMLNRAVGDGHGEVGLPAPGLPAEDQGAALGDEVRRERRAQEREADRGLVGEVEIVDRLEKGKAGALGEAAQARLVPLGDFFGDEDGEEVLITPLLLLRAPEEIPPDAARIGEVEALEQRIQRDGGSGGSARGRRAVEARGGVIRTPPAERRAWRGARGRPRGDNAGRTPPRRRARRGPARRRSGWRPPHGSARRRGGARRP